MRNTELLKAASEALRNLKHREDELIRQQERIIKEQKQILELRENILSTINSTSRESEDDYKYEF